MHRRTHLQQSAEYPGMGYVRCIANFVNGQIGCHQQGETGLVPLVYNTIDLLQRIFCSSLYTQIVNDQQGNWEKDAIYRYRSSEYIPPI